MLNIVLLSNKMGDIIKRLPSEKHQKLFKSKINSILNNHIIG